MEIIVFLMRSLVIAAAAAAAVAKAVSGFQRTPSRLVNSSESVIAAEEIFREFADKQFP